MKIEIDEKSGFCFGVIHAIREAESELAQTSKLYCLGDIVHNDSEIDRLAKLGMITITKEEFSRMQNCKVLIRAHGEPPETYEYARKNNITLIDATCPVVLRLQKRVKTSFQAIKREQGQLLFFGKPGHAETEGINGQTGYQSILIRGKEDLDKIDFSRPMELYSQTTMAIGKFSEIAHMIRERSGANPKVKIHDTVCRQVANREPHLKKFVGRFDVVIFVSGKKSSNGTVLYEICKSINPNTYRVDHPKSLQKEWFQGAGSAGICGATSTPRWLMESVADWIKDNC
jgi:4-hydroxy-3-methylbut-2-en-1-yl diphosphate reductase